MQTVTLRADKLAKAVRPAPRKGQADYIPKSIDGEIHARIPKVLETWITMQSRAFRMSQSEVVEMAIRLLQHVALNTPQTYKAFREEVFRVKVQS